MKGDPVHLFGYDMPRLHAALNELPIALVVAVLRAARAECSPTPLPAEGNVCGCFVTNPELERAGESVAS